MTIDTREWKNLKLEKVSEEEYREKYKSPAKKVEGVLSNLTPLTIGLTAAALIPFVIFFIKVRKAGKKIK